MAHFTYIKAPSGTWLDGDVPGGAAFTSIDQNLFKCINGDDGGTWAPAAPIIVGGQGMNIPVGATWTIAGTLEVNTAGGKIWSHVAGGITSDIFGGVTGTVIGWLRSGIVGGFQLSGGSTDWVQFSAARTRTTLVSGSSVRGVAVGAVVGNNSGIQVNSVDVTNSPYLAFGAAIAKTVDNTNQNAYLFVLDAALHDGATISTLTVNYKPVSTHTQVPAKLPALELYRVARDFSSAASLLSTFYVLDVATLAQYNNGWRALTLTTDQNNVIDRSTYVYYALFLDEGGAGALTGNMILNLQLGFTAISDMRFH